MRRWQANLRAASTRSPSTPRRRGKTDLTCLLTRYGRDSAHQRRDPQGGDAVPVLAQDLKTEAVKSEALSGLRDRARLVDDDAGDGGCLVVGNVPVHRPGEIAPRHRA